MAAQSAVPFAIWGDIHNGRRISARFVFAHTRHQQRRHGGIGGSVSAAAAAAAGFKF